MIKSSVDFVFGNIIIKSCLKFIFGSTYYKLLIHVCGYRACHMVSPGEYCVLAGIFYENTVRDFLQQVGPRGKVIVIEANSSNVERIKKSLRAPNLFYVTKAVFSGFGIANFLASSGEEQGYNRLDTGEMQEFPYHLDKKPDSIEVEMDSLDNIVSDLFVKKIDHINLTINGAELPALDGISSIIKNNNNVRIYINSEIPDPGFEVIEKLKDLNFKVYTSKLIRTVNKKIKLIRVYAVHRSN